MIGSRQEYLEYLLDTAAVRRDSPAGRVIVALAAAVEEDDLEWIADEFGADEPDDESFPE